MAKDKSTSKDSAKEDSKDSTQEKIEPVVQETKPASEPKPDILDKKFPNNYDRGGFSCAFVLIGIGILLLLNSTGVISWDIWSNLWRLWPLIFVIWGVEMIIGKNRVLSCAFGCFTAILFLLFILSLAVARDDSFKAWVDDNIGIDLTNIALIKEPDYKEEEYTVEDVDYKEVDSREVVLNFGAGQYTLTDDNSLNYLDANLKYADNFEEPEWNVEEKKGNLKIEFDTKQKLGAFLASYKNEYKFNFGRSDIETNMQVDLGAGEGNVNFDRLDMSKLDLDIGAGRLDIDLGSGAIPAEVIINVGAGEAVLSLPQDVELEIEYSIGAGELEIDGKSYGGDGNFVQDLDNSFETLKIKVDVGAGKLTIKRS